MTICEQISNDIKEAMKSKNIEKRDVLRSLDSMIKNEEIAQNKRKNGLDDDAIIVLVKRAIKQRKDSAEQFKNGGRNDLAKKEELEISFIEKYLPEQISEEKLRMIVQKIIDNIEIKDDNIGKVIGNVIREVGDAADGATIRRVVEDILSK